MNSATTAAAVQYRLKEWAAQIRECQNRPAGMSVVDWCATHDITKANYYYRLRRVRQACLENLPPEAPAQQIVSVNTCILQQKTQSGSNIQQGLSVSVNGFSIHVTESTPMPLLAAVLKVVRELTPQQFRWLMEGLTITPKKSVRPVEPPEYMG